MASGSSPGTESISSSASPIHSQSPPGTNTTTSSAKTTLRSSSITKTGIMHRTSAESEIALPVTYTPTTHRISKAKKGKRVHACEYPGCNKVFTRAEHRRRHQLNHNPEALFQCSYPGCRRAFQRHDLLTRHLERHELEARVDAAEHWKQLFQPTMTSEPSYMPKGMPANSNPFLPSNQQSNSMAIESIITPGIHLDLVDDQSQIWNGLDMPLNSQPSMLHNHVPEPTENNPFYSYPESCGSPSSDGTTFSLTSRPSSSISSTPATALDSYPENILDCGLTSSPTPLHSDLPSWDPSGTDLSPSNIVPLSLDGEYIHPSLQCHQSPTWTRPYAEYEAFQPNMKDEWSL